MTTFAALCWSLQLDYEFIFQVRGIPAVQKFVFVLKKYVRFLKDILFGLSETNSVKVFGREFYYNDVYGLASLQRVYCASHVLKSLLPEQPIIVDIGANVGQFTFFCRHYLQARRIISVEPLQECFRSLRLNAADPDDCVNLLISSEQGFKEIFRCLTSNQLSTCIKDDDESYADGVMVASKSLSALISGAGVGTIDLLKIDTEGSEFDVLRSGEEILDRVGTVLVEMSLLRRSFGNIFATGSFLNDHDFELVLATMSQGDRPKDLDAVFQRK